MVMLRLHRTCCTSSYLVHFLRKDRKPVASLLLSLTWCDQWRDRERRHRARRVLGIATVTPSGKSSSNMG